MSITGFADLPLHAGHVPPWLLKYMMRLGRAVLEVMLIELGPTEVLRRLSNPLWFQAFNNIIGMDWDSSGSTTVTTAVIKQALKDLGADVRVAGGKGRASLKTPQELETISNDLGIPTSLSKSLIRISRLGAKVDNDLIQDGFQLYHHAVVVDSRGEWVIIQQGMDVGKGFARRYHLAWFASRNITLEPHSGVASDRSCKPLNLTSEGSLKSRGVIIDLMNESPRKVFRELAVVNAYLKGQRTLFGEPVSPPREIIRIPYYRPVRLTSEMLRALESVYEVKPSGFDEALMVRGIGPEVLRALALISELIYREPPSLKDPVTHPFSPFKYSYAVGGKDGVPYPVRRDVVESVINELSRMIDDAKLGAKERLRAFRALKALSPPDSVSF